MRREAFGQPAERWLYRQVLVAQPVIQLHRKCPGQWRLVIFAQHLGQWFGVGLCGIEQTIGESVCGLARLAVAQNRFRQTAQILHQDDSQGDRNRPQLADRQRLHPLIGVDEAHQSLQVKTAVRVGDEGPRDPEDLWISGEVSVGEFRQLIIIARRQIAPDLADLLFDEMKIVEQPFGGRREGVPVARGIGNDSVGLGEDLCVLGKPPRYRPAGGGTGHNLLGCSQALCMGLKTLDAEKLRADRFFRRLWKTG